MAKAYAKLSLSISDFENQIVVNPGVAKVKKQVDSCNDPYVVMALSYLALFSDVPIVIKNVKCVYNLYADFFNDLKGIGVKVEFIYD